jgi:hypothetical protein
MKIKTFRDLQKALSKLNADQLSCDLISYSKLEDEWFPFTAKLKIADEEEIDVIDDQNPYLVLDFEGDNEANNQDIL